ncbi:hypothetical protein [Prochlorococcus marinus]|nr:hypothetical protein [Prochlorococcus marinus]
MILINPSILLTTEPPLDIEAVFVSSQPIEGDGLKYPKGKAEIRLKDSS